MRDAKAYPDAEVGEGIEPVGWHVGFPGVRCLSWGRAGRVAGPTLPALTGSVLWGGVLGLAALLALAAVLGLAALLALARGLGRLVVWRGACGLAVAARLAATGVLVGGNLGRASGLSGCAVGCERPCSSDSGIDSGDCGAG